MCPLFGIGTTELISLQQSVFFATPLAPFSVALDPHVRANLALEHKDSEDS